MTEPTPTTIPVTNCASCVFMRFNAKQDYMMCTCGARKVVEGYPDSPPSWCPLRTADRLVTLRVK
jgi:hypothetical protein